MAEATQTFDLHGMPIATVTEGFDDMVGYLERATVTGHVEAVRIFCEAWSVTADELDVVPIYMRWVDTDLEPVVVPELPCWLECGASDDSAVPFWKVQP
jgi:hypothetical protein